MDARPTAQPCRCDYPLRDRDTCLYCGRSVPVAPESRNNNDRTAPGNPWTRAGVLRALRAFVFFRGRAPIADDWSHRMAPDWPPLTVVERLFGSLPDALGAADIDRPSRTG